MRLSARRFLLVWVGGSLMLMMLIGLSSSHSSQFHAATHKPHDDEDIEKPDQSAEGSASASAASSAASAGAGGEEEPVPPPPVKKGKGKAVAAKKRAAKVQQAPEEEAGQEAAAEPQGAVDVKAEKDTEAAQPPPVETPEAAPKKKSKGKSKKNKKKGGGHGAGKHGHDGAANHHEAMLPPTLDRATQMWTGADPNKFTHVAVMHTDDGAITIGLYGREAPKSVANFVQLATSGWYNMSCFYRYEKGFVLQGGRCGSRNQNVEAPNVPLEYKLPNQKYTIALARTSDPDSGSSEFFINLRDNSQSLGPKKKGGYAVFGEVLSGIMDTIPAMKKRPVVVKKGALTRFEHSPKIQWIEIAEAPHH